MFLGGETYVDVSGNTVDRIAARSVVSIAKGEDDLWYQFDNKAILILYTPDELEFTIGEGGSPMNEGDLILVISNVPGIVQKSVQIFLDGSFLYKGKTDRISYGVVYTTNSFTVTFNQGVINGQTYNISYAQNL